MVKQITRAEQAYHDNWRTECDKRHDEYHAVVEVPKDVPDWQSQIFQPHLIPIIEGMIASMVEPNPRLIVRPRPRPLETPEEARPGVTPRRSPRWRSTTRWSRTASG